MIGYLKGLLFNCGLFFSSLFGGIFIMFPSFFFFLINKPDWFRKYNDIWGGFWLTFPGALLEILFGTKVVVSGDVVDEEKDRPLIIINHRCRLDWMFYWMVAQRNGRLYNEKIIMKHELKLVPGPGWCMQNLMYCFLKRRWEEDKSYLDRMIDYFIDINYPLQFFLFPEGTDLYEASLKNSDRFAEKNNLPKYKQVLHPRVKGFNYLVQKMRSNILNTVYDVTVGYPVNICYGEMDLVRGNFPKEVHFFFKRYEMTDLPSDSDELDKWCATRWAEKEERLRRFYENGGFDEECKDIISQRQLESTRIGQTLSLVFWFSFVAFSFYICWASLAVLCYAIATAAFYTFYNTRGGTDALLLSFHEANKKKM